jgi:hypothetical protein
LISDSSRPCHCPCSPLPELVPPCQRLRQAAAGLGAGPVTLAQLAALQGPAALGSLLVLLAAPCVLPVPGVGNVMGLALMMLALPMWRGQPIAALPAGVAGFQMPARWARRALLLMAGLYALAERITRSGRRRPQGAAPQPAQQPGPRPWLAAHVALMGGLIFLPLPLGNVLPALSLALLGLALALHDRLLMAGALAAGLLAWVYTAALGLAVWAWGLAPVLNYLGLSAR